MFHALAASHLAALLLACICRAARPGGLLDFLGEQWEAWLIFRPKWLPAKPTGSCVLCTCFWLPGIPVALAVALLTPAGWWALAVPFCVAVLSDILLSL
jgi:hypothetical protein